MAPEMAVRPVAVAAAAGRMPSMEAEPKTLTLEQLKFAREAALYVMSTKTAEEAIRIFTEGLKPVQLNVRKQDSAADSLSSSDDDVELGSSETYIACGGGSGCCRHVRAIKRDIATTPF